MSQNAYHIKSTDPDGVTIRNTTYVYDEEHEQPDLGITEDGILTIHNKGLLELFVIGVYYVSHVQGYEKPTPEVAANAPAPTTALERLKVERDDLAERLHKLNNFLDAPDRINLPDGALQRLRFQQVSMDNYLVTLNQRIQLDFEQS